MKKYIYAIMLLAMVSCSEEVANEITSDNVDNNIILGKKYQYFLKANKAIGSVLIQSNTTRAMQKIIKNIDFSKKKSRQNSKSKGVSKELIRSQSIVIKGFNLNGLERQNGSNTSKELENLYGKKITYFIEKKSKSYGQNGSSSEVDEKELYVPKLLTVSLNSEDNLEDGTIISWNIDELNENGVALILTYEPILQPNLNLAYENLRTVVNSMVVADNEGEYVFKPEDISMFPENALISINVVRGAYEIDEETDLALAAVTNMICKPLRKIGN